jgi:hypothetical protein
VKPTLILLTLATIAVGSSLAAPSVKDFADPRSASGPGPVVWNDTCHHETVREQMLLARDLYRYGGFAFCPGKGFAPPTSADYFSVYGGR